MMHFCTENPSSGRIQAGAPIFRRAAFRALFIVRVMASLRGPLRRP